jgi:hypothetical protein
MRVMSDIVRHSRTSSAAAMFPMTGTITITVPAGPEARD